MSRLPVEANPWHTDATRPGTGSERSKSTARRRSHLSLWLGLLISAGTAAAAQDHPGAQTAMPGSGHPAAQRSTVPQPAVSTTPLQGQGSHAFYCEERKLGTWFYCERPKPAPPQTVPHPPELDPSATVRLAAVTQRLDELKARAVLEPTAANVTAYIRYQREQLDRASTFADVWQRAMWQDPELDYTLQRPVSSLGKRAWLDNRKEEQDRALRQLSQRYGIFYFYAQSCGACEIFAPILKAAATRGGFDVVAVSMDGGPNRVFPNHVVDTGQHARMGLRSRATPALVLYDTATQRPIPIGTGILSQDEITQRIFALTNTQPGSDF